jgi:L-serine/L-threonine ammonia-lyase
MTCTAKPLHVVTPLLESRDLSRVTGKQVFLKMECFQNAGSYKIRGIGLFCSRAREAGKTRLVASSAGNAGYAVAYAGNRLAMDVTVVVPETTSQEAKDRIASEGARVEVHGSVWDEADAFGRDLAARTDAAYVHPFDHPTLWEGYRTLVREAYAEMDRPDAVVLSVGGGGMMCGVLEGLHEVGWGSVPLVAVEPEGAASFGAALKAGQVVPLDRISTVATSLATRRVTPQTVAWACRHDLRAVTVSDVQAVSACRRFADDHRALVEPACGATLSTLYDNHPALAGARSVLAVVCGGIGVSMARLAQWEQDLGLVSAA